MSTTKLPPGTQGNATIPKMIPDPNEWLPSLPTLSLCLLTFTTAQTAFQAREDPWKLVFVFSVYVCLMLLFWCLRLYSRLPETSSSKERLKLPIWVLATTVNIVFGHRVSMLLNPPMQCLVWAMAGCSSLFGFYFLFIYRGVSASTNGRD